MGEKFYSGGPSHVVTTPKNKPQKWCCVKWTFWKNMFLWFKNYGVMLLSFMMYDNSLEKELVKHHQMPKINDINAYYWEK